MGGKLIFDFTDPGVAETWYAIDDRVMGGVSRSRLRYVQAGHAVFEGEVSLARNGGFASVRSPSGGPGVHGLEGAEACLIEVRAAGGHFKLSLLTDELMDGVNYQSGFMPEGVDWHTLRLPLHSFRPSFRGRDVADARPLDPARIRQIGLLIAAGQAGAFRLDIRRISLA